MSNSPLDPITHWYNTVDFWRCACLLLILLSVGGCFASRVDSGVYETFDRVTYFGKSRPAVVDPAVVPTSTPNAQPVRVNERVTRVTGPRASGEAVNKFDLSGFRWDAKTGNAGWDMLSASITKEELSEVLLYGGMAIGALGGLIFVLIRVPIGAAFCVLIGAGIISLAYYPWVGAIGLGLVALGGAVWLVWSLYDRRVTSNASLQIVHSFDAGESALREELQLLFEDIPDLRQYGADRIADRVVSAMKTAMSGIQDTSTQRRVFKLQSRIATKQAKVRYKTKVTR